MAMAEFLRNVQTARNVTLSHMRLHPEPDYASLRGTAGVWLSPQVVAGFDPSDFEFLPAGERDSLADAVNGFRVMTESVSDREPAPDEMKLGIGYLFTIISLLEAKLLDAEGKALLDAIDAAKKPFPPFVLGFDYTLDTDATGDPGIWIWVLVPDDLDPDSTEFKQFVTRFSKAVRETLAKVKSDRLPYIHYRPLSEAVGLLSEGVA